MCDVQIRPTRSATRCRLIATRYPGVVEDAEAFLASMPEQPGTLGRGDKHPVEPLPVKRGAELASGLAGFAPAYARPDNSETDELGADPSPGSKLVRRLTHESLWR